MLNLREANFRKRRWELLDFIDKRIYVRKKLLQEVKDLKEKALRASQG